MRMDDPLGLPELNWLQRNPLVCSGVTVDAGRYGVRGVVVDGAGQERERLHRMLFADVRDQENVAGREGESHVLVAAQMAEGTLGVCAQVSSEIGSLDLRT